MRALRSPPALLGLGRSWAPRGSVRCGARWGSVRLLSPCAGFLVSGGPLLGPFPAVFGLALLRVFSGVLFARRSPLAVWLLLRLLLRP